MVLINNIGGEKREKNFQHFNWLIGRHRSTWTANLSEGKMAHKEANISGWMIVPTPQWSKQHSPSRTSNTSTQLIGTLVPVQATSAELPTLEPKLIGTQVPVH